VPELSNASGIGMYIWIADQTLETVHSASSAGEFIDLDARKAHWRPAWRPAFEIARWSRFTDTRRSPFFRRKIS